MIALRTCEARPRWQHPVALLHDQCERYCQGCGARNRCHIHGVSSCSSPCEIRRLTAGAVASCTSASSTGGQQHTQGQGREPEISSHRPLADTYSGNHDPQHGHGKVPRPGRRGGMGRTNCRDGARCGLHGNAHGRGGDSIEGLAGRYRAGCMRRCSGASKRGGPTHPPTAQRERVRRGLSGNYSRRAWVSREHSECQVRRIGIAIGQSAALGIRVRDYYVDRAGGMRRRGRRIEVLLTTVTPVAAMPSIVTVAPAGRRCP